MRRVGWVLATALVVCLARWEQAPEVEREFQLPGGGGVHLIHVPAGAFLMGNNGREPYCYPNELPRHSVYLSDYWIGKYEVTRGQYRRFIEAGGYSNPDYWSKEGWEWKSSRKQPGMWEAKSVWGPPLEFTQTDDYPVTGVSYYEAEAFCNWAGLRLPTEAQWEKAARWDGRRARIFPWGDKWDAGKCNNWYDKQYEGYQSAPIGSYPSGASAYGCLDMAGNLWEWCRDWYDPDYYSAEPRGGWVDPRGPARGECRVMRGGSWYYFDYNTRCAYRGNYFYPGNWYYEYGFRVALGKSDDGRRAGTDFDEVRQKEPSGRSRRIGLDHPHPNPLPSRERGLRGSSRPTRERGLRGSSRPTKDRGLRGSSAVSWTKALYGAEAYRGKDPIGGGKGYTRMVDRSAAGFVVSTLDELKAALASAKAGDVVYIADNARIDLTGENEAVVIPGGVTIAGNRGRKRAAGPTIFTTNLGHYPMLTTGGAGVRFTGLRLQGPDTQIRATGEEQLRNAVGVVVNHPDCEFDNCEILGWSAAGVQFSDAGPGRVHHCYIHHNRRAGNGYGVYVHECYVAIEANIFAENRHDIAGSGRPGSSYRACYNFSIANEPFTSHAFDMHGNHNSRAPGEVVPHIAGDSIVIAYNTFVSCRPRIYIAIRGEPRQGAIIHHNEFQNAFIGADILEPCGNAVIYDNKFTVPAKRASYKPDSDGNLVDGKRAAKGER